MGMGLPSIVKAKRRVSLEAWFILISKKVLLFSTAVFVSSIFPQFVPTKSDSGWRPLFNGTDLNGLFPHIDGYSFGVNPPLGLIDAGNGILTFYPGFTYGGGDPGNNGYLSTGTEYSYYRCRVEFRHGDYTNRNNSGWLNGDPYNSGFFYHVKPGAAVWPPAIECQLKRHWNSNAPNGGTTCTAANGDCNQIWAADFWILGGAQIRNRNGQLTALGGCCNPALVNRNQFPDYELEGWNWMEIEVYADSAFSNIFNGQRINWGTQSTYQNSSGQRVPLTEGAIALELEGSEIEFRNWEIMLFKRDPLYDSMYTPGCMDPSFQEYSAAADLHVDSLCVNAIVPIALPKGREASGFSFDPREAAIQFNRGTDALYFLYDVNGENVLSGKQAGPGQVALKHRVKPGIYFLRINQNSGEVKKRILIF